MSKRLMAFAGALGFVVLAAPAAFACGGLVAPDGAVNLVRTTTLAAYKDGVEHYVTSFEFRGGGAKFGSIVPLPDEPTKVIRGGDWTLQRLIEETQFELSNVRTVALADAAGTSAEVVLEVEIDALDITVVKGGGDGVGKWAKDNGFSLPPDAPEVLDFYADRSPYFMAARFNLARARAEGIDLGDGTPVHLVIPTDDPWVPLRILGLGKQAEELIEADVYLLTERRPALLPSPSLKPGIDLEVSEPASRLLLSDLRSDKGMKWLPPSGMWLSYLRLDTTAGELTHDLAIDATGAGAPSARDAGLLPPIPDIPRSVGTTLWTWLIAAAVGLLLLIAANRAIRA